VDNTSIEIYFGMDMSKINDDTFTIYSSSSSTYNMIKAEDNPNYNRKEIFPVWFNKTTEGSYIGFSDGIYSLKDYEDEPIGEEYDEDEYLQKYKEYEKIARLKLTNLEADGIPAI